MEHRKYYLRILLLLLYSTASAPTNSIISNLNSIVNQQIINIASVESNAKNIDCDQDYENSYLVCHKSCGDITFTIKYFNINNSTE